MWLIVGLGNPGREYAGTRHNIGFMVVDELARRAGAGAFASKFKGELAQASIGRESGLLLKPQTFMNLSGQSVLGALTFYKVPLDTLVVVHDDLDLELGQIKMKRGGSAGGHNGIKSIDGQIGPDYFRVRAGIGHPRREGQAGRVVGHVLGPFKGDEKKVADALISDCADAVTLLVSDGLLAAQQRFHGKKPIA